MSASFQASSWAINDLIQQIGNAHKKQAYETIQQPSLLMRYEHCYSVFDRDYFLIPGWWELISNV